MRMLTKETDYAIRAVASLAARPGAVLSSAEISRREAIPLPFLRRILGRLLRAGLVASREGAAGGVSLAARPEEIRVLDIMRIFQGDVRLSECMFRKRICANRGTCVLRTHIRRIERSITEQFGAISIADLLRSSARGNAPRAKGPPAGKRATEPAGSAKSGHRSRAGAPALARAAARPEAGGQRGRKVR
jgi:Rrf2 family protein